MHGQSRRMDRHTGVFLDVFHVVAGIGIVILAVLSFVNPEGNIMLFPLVFLLAGVLNTVNCVFELKTCGRNKKKRRFGILQAFLAAVLFLLGVISGISIWI